MAIDKNRVNKILAYCHDINHYAEVVIKFPEQRLDHDERVHSLLPENQKNKKKSAAPPIMSAHSTQPLAPAVKPATVKAEEKKEEPKIVKPDEPKQSSTRPQPEKQLGGGVKKTPDQRKGKTKPPKEVQGSLF